MTLASAAAQTDALWATLARDRPLDRCRAAAAGRAVLADRRTARQTHAAADADRAERDGPAGADDRLREHRRAGAGARRVATRRNRRAAGARRDADADRPAADCRKPRPRRARRRPRRPARVARRSRCWSATPRRSPRRSALFFNIEVDRLVIGFAVLVACGSALVFGFVPALQSSRVDLVSVINEDASPRGAARGRLRAGLVVAQVAVSLLLLVGAGLVDAQPRGGAARESGLRREPRDGDRARRQAERLRRARAAACSIATCWTRRAPIPASNRRRSRRTTPLAFLDTPRAARGDRGLRAASRRRSGVPVEHRRPRLLPHAADPARGRAASSKIATTRRRRRWRSSTTRSRSDSGAARRTRSASASASATATGGRSSAWRRT